MSEFSSSAPGTAALLFDYRSVAATASGLLLVYAVVLGSIPRLALAATYRFSRVDRADPHVTDSSLAVPAGGGLPDVLIVYTTCHNAEPFALWRTSVPAVGLECDDATRASDCNEAVPFLNFLIRHYDAALAERYLFAHGHNRAWHYQGDFFAALETLRASRYWRRNDYGGLFRGWYAGGAWGADERWWAEPLYRFVFANTSLPAEPIDRGNFRPCCSTFWFKAALVRGRPKDEYVAIRDRLRAWSAAHADARPSPAFYCGRIMEYNWHILLAGRAYIPRCHFCQGYYV
jgi:hypothetical protein